jgi:DNA-binding response OmpR family regulator
VSSETKLPREVVLVVEDEILIRYVISDYLRECGYKVIEASSTDEALLVLNDTNLSVDVVFSNAQVAGATDGFALAQWVRANRAGVGVILVGSISRAADAAANLCEHGPMLSKPYQPKAVVERIKLLLAQKRQT